MTQAEVFHALHVGAGGGEPTDLRSLGLAVARLGFGQFEESILLRAVLAIRGPKVDRDFRQEFGGDEDPAETFRAAQTALQTVVSFLQRDARIPHRRVLPYALVVPVLARFFHLFPAPTARSRILLRRWLWRGAATGVQADGFTPALRRAVRAVEEDEHGSAQRLLGQVVADPPPLDLSSVRLTEAAARASLALLATLGPLDVTSGEPIEVAALLDQEAPLPRLGVGPGRSRSLAQIFLHPGIEDLDAALVSADAEVLSSHGVPPAALARLVEGDATGFVAARETYLRERLTAIRDSLAEWGATDRPPLAALAVPDDAP